MSRSYGKYYSSYSMDDYLERLKRIERMPSMIADTPQFPNVHEVLNHPMYDEANNDHHNKIPNKNHHQSPHEVQKKVHFVEQEKESEVSRDVKRDVEDKTIDVEADGFIKQKHKGFELCKWNTFKVY